MSRHTRRPHPRAAAPPKYGNTIKRTDGFATPKEHCVRASCAVYGHVEIVSSLVLNLLWKPIKAPRRFICARTSRGPIVLMGSDLDRDPLMASYLYCDRERIETLYSMLTS